MKKTIMAAIIFYAVLLGGFLIFLLFCVIGRLYYSDEIQKFGENHTILTISLLILYFLLYLYAIKLSVSTKNFLEYEKQSLKKWDSNEKKRRVICKKIAVIWLVFEIIHIFIAVRWFINRTTNADSNFFMRIWFESIGYTPICLGVFIWLCFFYKKKRK